MRRVVRIAATCLVLAAPAAAQNGPVRLAAPEALRTSGLLAYILPRFSLKTQVRVEVVPPGAEADIALGDEGRAVFAEPGRTWHVLAEGDHPGAQRLLDWLTGEVGRTTITGYAPGGAPLYTLPPEGVARVAAPVVEGDADAGLEVSRVACARCHAVEEGGRMGSIGSTPSFFVLRGMDDWQQRFQAFYVLAPHGAFTQIAEVTAPFPIERPSPIAPVEMTLEDLEAVVAYVASLPAADLGAPLRVD